MFRKLIVALSLLCVLIGGLYIYARAEARRDPVVRTAAIRLPRWPAGAKPVRAVLIGDIHTGSAAMDQARLTRIIAQVNALRPDIVLIAGDFIAGHDRSAAARFAPDLVAPLSRLRAPLGVVAVLGNHDYWTGAAAVRAELARAGVTLLVNRAIRRGPLAIGGIDDDFTHHDNIAATLTQLRPLRGARVLLTHSPDLAPELPEGMPLLLAGHTHCGQLVVPLYGPVRNISPFGERYLCGLRREGNRATIVTAGLGTSVVPLRFGAPPDLWMLTLGS